MMLFYNIVIATFIPFKNNDNIGIMEPSYIWKDSIYNRKNWEFHNDPGFNKKLNWDTIIKEKQIYDNIPYCKKKILFIGQYYDKTGSIETFEENTLMISLTNNFTLGECFFINHKTKDVYVWQSTTKDLSKSNIKETTILRVMTGLGMLNNTFPISLDYKLTIIFCVDWGLKITHGSKFLVKKPTDEKNKNDFFEFTLKEWQSHERGNKDSIAYRIKTIIARVCYYPHIDRFSF